MSKSIKNQDFYKILDILKEAKEASTLKTSNFDGDKRQQPNESNTDFIRRCVAGHHEFWIEFRIAEAIKLLKNEKD